MVVTVAAGGWLGSVSAAEASLPGDVLYSVKLAGEKTQIAVARVTGNKKSEFNLQMDHATNRAREIKEVIIEKPEEIKETVNKLNESVEEIFGTGDEYKQVCSVKLAHSKEIISAQMIIEATGIKTDLSIIDGTNIAKNKGILVNENMKTNYDNIYACGDILSLMENVLDFGLLQ